MADEDEEIEIESSKNCCSRLGRFLAQPRFKLYCSYALSTWGDRSWTYVLSLSLFQVGLNLQLPAISNFANALTVITFGVVIGHWIDGAPRLRAARWILVANNILVALSAGCLIAVLWAGEEIRAVSIYLYWALVILAIILCALDELAGAGTKIVVAKDWVVIMSRGDNKELADLNAAMVRIDHVTSIVSPILAGVIMEAAGYGAGCVFVAAWNVLSLPLEYYLLKVVYNAVPELALPKTPSGIIASDLAATKLRSETTASSSSSNSHPATVKTPLLTKKPSHPRPPAPPSILSRLLAFVHGWRSYFQQPVFPAAFALCLLYLTVLGLSGIFSSYVVSQGISPDVLGIARGVAALSGILGTVVFPPLRARFGLGIAGLSGIVFEILMLGLPLASVWLPGSPFELLAANQAQANVSAPIELSVTSPTTGQPHSVVSVWVLLLGVVLSRAGLWLADLSITQMMQETVKEEERGAVFGVQSALQSTMSLLKDVLVIILPNPETYGYLIIVSFTAIATALVSFLFSFRQRSQDKEYKT